MPLKPIDYSKTIMYKLCCNDLNITDIYIGHTTDFKSRKRQHKSNCNNEKNKNYNFNVYQFIRNNGGWNNWSMIMIEEYSCSSLLEATKRERELIEELKANLNSQVPSRTIKEYYEDNKDKIKERKKEYYEDNKDKIKEKDKEYYENNKDKIKEKKKERFNCDCGGCYTYNHKAQHEKTKRHQEWLKTI
jgi:hypothetical protein